MNLLVLNCGSSTVKFKLFDGRLRAVAGGTWPAEEGGYRRTIETFLGTLDPAPDAVAHRVVHGGRRFDGPVLLTPEVEEEIRRLVPLAPLHNGPALEGIAAARRGGWPMVAVFDTSFHATLPEAAWRYPLPRDFPAEIRRFGFHGLSHAYVTRRYAELSGSSEPTLVSLHLGNGASAAAVRKGRCVDTSMGMTPLEGLVMGTRAGDLDPGILLYLLRQGRSLESLERALQVESGLKALAGTSDMRSLLSRDDAEARLAIDIFCRGAKKYLGAYLGILGGAEAVIFTGGIGENSPEIRRRVCEGFGWAGLSLDAKRNQAGNGRISSDGGRLAAWAIPTDEERVIAEEAVRILGG